MTPPVRISLGILSVLLVLLLNLLVASLSLHEVFHAGAGHAGHQCAVTLFAHGQIDSATANVSPAAAADAVHFSPQFGFSVFAPAIENLSAGRGPPVSSVNS